MQYEKRYPVFLGQLPQSVTVFSLQKSRVDDDAVLRSQCPGGQVEPHLGSINTLCDGDDIHEIIDNIVSLQTQDPWLSKAGDSLGHGSSLAALWIYRQLVENRHASLREVFQSEIQLAK